MISVSPDDFAPTPELAQALRRDARDGRPIYELVVPRRSIVDDLAAVPMDATFVATRGTACHLERIPALDRLQALWANPASAELFRVCAQAPALRALYVCHFKRLNLASSSFCDFALQPPADRPLSRRRRIMLALLGCSAVACLVWSLGVRIAHWPG